MSEFNPATNPGSSRKYTPIFPEIAAEYGLTCAAVYGVIWRYAQMRDGTCHAAYDTLAAEIGVNERTMRRNVEELQKAKLIHLHHRKNGGPYWISISADIQSDRTESPLGTSDRTESPERPDIESATDRTQSPIRKQDKKPIKRPLNATRSRKTPRKRKKLTKRPFFDLEEQALVDHFSEATGLRIPKLGGSAFGSVTKSWKMPLRGILETTGTVDGACELISRTVQEMRGKELAIAAPRSIWKMALSIEAKGETNGHAEPAGFKGIREAIGE